MKEVFEPVLVALASVAIMVCIVGGVVSCSNTLDSEHRAREARKVKLHCEHTGYYGRYTEKVYKCDGIPVIREYEI